MRWLVMVVAMLAGLATRAAAEPCPGAVELPGLRTERTVTYRCGDGLYATSSEARPLHWPDGVTWRRPVLTWEKTATGAEARTIPGSIVYAVEPDGLHFRTRTGARIARLDWWTALPMIDGAVVRFEWRGIPCRFELSERGGKLACTVAARLGKYRLTVPTPNAWAVDELGAVVAGDVKLDPLLIVGADGNDYAGRISGWHPVRGGLSIVVDDLSLPEAAFPYTIDPSTGPNYPSTCTSQKACRNATYVYESPARTCTVNGDCTNGSFPTCGATAWASPSSAQTSNDVRTTASLTNGVGTELLKCVGYGFTATPLDDAKIIKGVLAEIEAQTSGSTVQILDTRLVKGGMIQAANACGTGTCTGPTQPCQCALTTSDTVRTAGSSQSLWGATLAPSDVRDGTFGVALEAKQTAGGTGRTARIDSLRLTVYYAPPSGRVYATGWDSFGKEDGTETGSPQYLAAAKRTGVAGMRLSTTANTAERWCTPAALDSDLTDRGYLRHYWATEPTLATPASGSPANTVFVDSIQQDSEVGCYLLLKKDSAGCYSYQVRYHGKESVDLNFGTFVASNSPNVTCATALAGKSVSIGQLIVGSVAACPLYIDGQLAQNFTLPMLGDCSGGACDIAGACVGSPATGTVDDYSSFPAFTLDVDDFVLDNLSAPGVGYVKPLYPAGTGSVSTWSNTCGGTVVGCVDDWATGVEDACVSDGDTRQKTTGTGDDLYSVDDISPALGASDSIKSLRALGACCTQGGTVPETLHLQWRSSRGGTTDVSSSDFSPAVNTKVLVSETRSNSPTTGEPTWIESEVNGLQIGVGRNPATGSAARCSAEMVYADINTTAPAADRNMQDWNNDGKVSLLAGCDSITKGTRTATCLGGADTGCTRSCTVDADCGTGAVCNTDGKCTQPCEVADECTCSTGAICTSAFNWVNQLSLRVPQVDNLVLCGRDTMPSQWWQSVLPSIIADPATLDPPCSLVRGDWGYCSSTTTQGCTENTDCPVGQTCVHYAMDEVADICGVNEFIEFGMGDCLGTQAGSAVKVSGVNNRWGQQGCPLAEPSPVGAYSVLRKTCTTNADCTGDASYGTGSVCAGACSGHTDPVWPCQWDDQCGSCSLNAARSCYHQGACVNNGAYILLPPADLFTHYERCSVDGDCPAGTCQAYADISGPWADSYGTCGDCTHANCDTSTKYCTPTCASISCATDADCGTSGGVGGVCNTGTGKCQSCGLTGDQNYDASASTQQLVQRRVWNSPGDISPDKEFTRVNSINATALAAGAHRVEITYGLTMQMGTGEAVRNLMVAKARNQLAKSPVIVDLHNALRFYDNRISGNATNGTIVGFDGVHLFLTGAAVTANLVAPTLNSLYPVCSGNEGLLCGACEASCTVATQATDCASPGATGGAGTCSGTPGVCQCTTDSNCAPGMTCKDIQAGAGVDKRCIVENISSCPVGNSVSQRTRPRADEVCSAASAGTCTVEHAPKLCTVSKIRCSTTADCPGAAGGTPTPGSQMAKGDVCADSGAYIPCQVDAECRTPGAYSSDVCAGWPPTTPGTATPKARACQAKTPTP